MVAELPEAMLLIGLWIDLHVGTMFILIAFITIHIYRVPWFFHLSYKYRNHQLRYQNASWLPVMVIITGHVGFRAIWWWVYNFKLIASCLPSLPLHKNHTKQKQHIFRGKLCLSVIIISWDTNSACHCVSRPNPKQLLMIYLSELLMVIRWSIDIPKTFKREMRLLMAYSPIYCIKEMGTSGSTLYTHSNINAKQFKCSNINNDNATVYSTNKHTLLEGHIMMTSSNGNISVQLAICAGNSPVPSEFPT